MFPTDLAESATRILVGCNEALPPERARDLCVSVLGVDPHVATSGQELVDVALRERPDLILTPVDLAGQDGLEAVRRLRAEDDNVPVLFVSRRTDHNAVIAGFAAGADDYVAWPSDPTELQLRIRALLRRSSWERKARQAVEGLPEGQGTPGPEAHPRQVGDVAMSPATREVTRGGVPVELTPTEYALLEFLMEHPGQVLSRRQILEAVWGPHQAGREAVDTYVRYLRRKLDPLGPPAIHTRRGYGYVFDPGQGSAQA